MHASDVDIHYVAFRGGRVSREWLFAGADMINILPGARL